MQDSLSKSTSLSGMRGRRTNKHNPGKWQQVSYEWRGGNFDNVFLTFIHQQMTYLPCLVIAFLFDSCKKANFMQPRREKWIEHRQRWCIPCSSVSQREESIALLDHSVSAFSDLHSISLVRSIGAYLLVFVDEANRANKGFFPRRPKENRVHFRMRIITSRIRVVRSYSISI